MVPVPEQRVLARETEGAGPILERVPAQGPEEFLSEMNKLCMAMSAGWRTKDGKKSRKRILRRMKKLEGRIAGHARRTPVLTSATVDFSLLRTADWNAFGAVQSTPSALHACGERSSSCGVIRIAELIYCASVAPSSSTDSTSTSAPAWRSSADDP